MDTLDRYSNSRIARAAAGASDEEVSWWKFRKCLGASKYFPMGISGVSLANNKNGQILPRRFSYFLS